jgi:hypothetical protein
MARPPGIRFLRRSALLLSLIVAGSGCQFAGVSEAGRDRCRRLSASAGDPFTAALSQLRCLPTTDRLLAIEQAERKAAGARTAALESCRLRQRRISDLIASLHRSEQALATARSTPFRPSVAPPAPLDATRESRYRLEDQQLDRERYETALEAWEQQVAGEKWRWRQERAERMAAAQKRLDRDHQALLALQPDLFTAPGSIEFDPAAVARVNAACGASLKTPKASVQPPQP